MSKKTTAYKGPQLRRLWIALTLIVIGSFAVLLYYGAEIYRKAPPIPERVVTTDGTVLFTGEDIRDRARMSGSRSAARSSARSGATAPTSRRTGPPTGCTARRCRCSTDGPERARRRTSRRCADETAGRAASAAAGGASHQHLRPASGELRGVGGPRRGDRGRVRSLHGPVRRRSRDSADLREAYAMPTDTGRRCRTRGRPDRLLLLDLLGLRDRAARRESPTPTTGRPTPWSATGRAGVIIVVGCELRAAPRRDRRPRLVLRRGATPGRGGRPDRAARERPAGRAPS